MKTKYKNQEAVSTHLFPQSLLPLQTGTLV